MGSVFLTFNISRSALARLVAIVRNDLVPLVSGRARNKGNYGFSFAHVEDLMWDAGFDVDEIAGFVLDYLFKPGAEFVAYLPFDDVKDHFEIDMNVRVCDAAWRDGGNVRG